MNREEAKWRRGVSWPWDTLEHNQPHSIEAGVNCELPSAEGCSLNRGCAVSPQQSILEAPRKWIYALIKGVWGHEQNYSCCSLVTWEGLVFRVFTRLTKHKPWWKWASSPAVEREPDWTGLKDGGGDSKFQSVFWIIWIEKRIWKISQRQMWR